MDDEECPDCLCPLESPGEWLLWLAGHDEPVIMTYCGCGCHEDIEPAAMAG